MTTLLLAPVPSAIHVSDRSRSLLPRISRESMRQLIDLIDGTPDHTAATCWNVEDVDDSERAWDTARATLVQRARELRQEGMFKYPAATSLQSVGRRV